MKNRYSKEIHNFISSHVEGISCKELAKITNEAMGTNFSESQMKSYKTNHKLKSNYRPSLKGRYRVFNDEVIEYVKNNVRNLYNKELTRLINEKFDKSYTLEQIEALKARLKISSGLTGYFEAGHTPKNKGKKVSIEQYEKCSKTMFKKGNLPHNHRPVGSERINKDGYVEIKIEEPNKWKPKHIVVYEKYYGSVPTGHNVIFLDKNKENVDINNLALVTKAQMARLNQGHMISEFPEVTKAGIVLEKYKEAIRKRIKNGQKNKAKV